MVEYKYKESGAFHQMEKEIMIIENELIRVSLIRLGASIYDIEIFDGKPF